VKQTPAEHELIKKSAIVIMEVEQIKQEKET